MSWLYKIFGDPNKKAIQEIQPIVDKINALEPQMQVLTLEQLKEKTAEFKKRLNPAAGNVETLEDILPEAFAVVREVSKRVLGMRHFDVQLVGGVVLHRGQISEMRTGEGKTLVATLPLYLNALAGKGAHLVTVNDYLAKRDAVWMGKIYHALGLSVGIIQNLQVSYKYNPNITINENKENENTPAESKEKEEVKSAMYKVQADFIEPCTRAEAYACDITYGTNNEFGFDYLRDNMVAELKEMVQKPFFYAIVDEVDSILIDEARTPLIISAPAEEAADMYYKFADLTARLEENADYNVDEKMRSATLTEGGIKKMEQWLGVDNIYVEGGMNLVHHVEQSLRAHTLFKRDRDYVVENGEVIIVDEFTGRKMPGRRYSEGLHQAIEAQERVKIQRESRTMATVTFQNYFRMYPKLSGMTGTAVTEAEEFGKIYNLEVVVVPTHRQNKRQDNSDRIYKTEEGKFKAIAQMVKDLQIKGQPALIGTISVEKNEVLSIFLEREGIKHEILNAKNHEREGEIIAQAGKPGAVTLATNMAGRGVDIILGGNPPDANLAQKARDAGGLFVIGTERHESRRIDNQLRGRAGRQGDHGATQFFLSTEDDLMRVFAGDRIRGVMHTLRVPEDMPIENRSLSKIIEAAQKKVEGFHFDTRKHLLEYDDVLNRHREVIYGRRRQVLDQFYKEKTLLSDGEINEYTHAIPPPRLPLIKGEEVGVLPIKGEEVGVSLEMGGERSPLLTKGEQGGGESVYSPLLTKEGQGEVPAEKQKTLRELILEMVENEIEQIVSFHTNDEDKKVWNVKEICENINTIFPLNEEERTKILSLEHFGEQKMDAVNGRSVIIETLTQWAKEKYQKMLVEKVPEPEMLLEIEKQVLLRAIDNLWIDHLVAIDYLRTGIGLRGYGQRDPLVEYKKETYHMFNELLSLIQREVVYTVYKVSAGIDFAPGLMKKANLILRGAGDSANVNLASRKIKDAQGKDVGRNDPCPCGSGKKFKRCCGA